MTKNLVLSSYAVFVNTCKLSEQFMLTTSLSKNLREAGNDEKVDMLKQMTVIHKNGIHEILLLNYSKPVTRNGEKAFANKSLVFWLNRRTGEVKEMTIRKGRYMTKEDAAVIDAEREAKKAAEEAANEAKRKRDAAWAAFEQSQRREAHHVAA
jgi:hypothetical protein